MKQHVNEKNIRACIEFMKASNDVAFGMHLFTSKTGGEYQKYYPPVKEHKCKTASCLAGFECLRLGESLTSRPEHTAAKSFGIKICKYDLRAGYLFSPAGCLNGGFSWSAQFGEEGYITKEHAIECLELLIETEEVRWVEAKQRLDAKELGLTAEEKKRVYDLFLPKEFHTKELENEESLSRVYASEG